MMINISPQDALELPVDELALLVLADIIQQNAWSQYNYELLYEQEMQYGWSTNPDARKAISEAVGWLHQHGLLAYDLSNNGANAIIVTRKGREALAVDSNTLRSIHRLEADLHPLLQLKVRRQFLLGEYENAIFVAMKAIEVRVRKLGGFGNDIIGVDLINRAFRQGGPLADPAAPTGEVDGTMMLFRGAYAVLRNPSGHREVSFDDVTEASEAVMTASLLMRMLDRIEKRLATSTRPAV